MARTKYTVTFPAAKAGDEVTWPNAVKVYADANIDRPLGNGYIETAAGSFTGWSDAASVTFTRAGTSDSVTVTAGSPTGTGAALPSAASGAGLPSTIVSKTAPYTATAGDFVEADTSGGRSVADGVTTNASATVTSATANFVVGDIGRYIVSANLPANTTITAVGSTTSATVSANATASGTAQTFVIGGYPITLPAAPAVGALVAVKKISNDTYPLGIVASGGGTVDGASITTTQAQWAGLVLEHKGSNVWRVAASMSTTGPAGPTGSTGPTGPAGPTGPSGSGAGTVLLLSTAPATLGVNNADVISKDGNQWFGCLRQCPNPAVNNAWTWTPWLPGGTYDIDLYYGKGTSNGIFQVSIDGTNVGAAVDTYNATVANAITTLTGVTITGDGSHTFKCLVTSKNASSTNYYMVFSGFQFRRTA